MKRFGGVLAFIGAIFLILSFREGVAYMLPHVDLYADETNVSDIGSLKMVEAEVYASFDYFASETTTENGRKTSEQFYYIIPAYNGEEMYYIGVKVNQSKSRTLDKIIDITYDYLMGYSDEMGETTVNVTGCLKKMNKEEKKYYFEWFEEMEWFENEKEMNTYALPLYIDDLVKPETNMFMVLGGGAVLLVGVVLLVIGFTLDKRGDKKAADQTHVVIGGVTYPKSTFAHVNQCINSQERAFAAQELHEITGISLEEAGNIIANWSKYYY